MKNKIIILTPSYNRVNTLPRLYKSLAIQNNRNFEWLIIDDGSFDGTKEYIQNIIKEKKVNINYIFQNNRGKSSAVNTGFDNCKDAQMVAIVDSDDYLLPDAINTLERYCKKYEHRDVGAFFFHYKNQDGSLIKSSKKLILCDQVMNRYEYTNKYGKYDGCICYFNNVIKEYRFPIYENEKYIGPTVLQMMISNKYKMVFSPEIVGIAEYQKDGLTNSGRALRLKNPKGMICYSKLMMNHKSKLSIRFKYALSIWPYLDICKISILDITSSLSDICLLVMTYLPGKILSIYWRKKYQK